MESPESASTPVVKYHRLAVMLLKLFGNDRRTLLLFACVFTITILFRIAGIRWALPDSMHPFSTFHPDETVNLAVAKSINLGRGNIDIKYYNYGALYFYLVSFAMAAGKAYHLVPAVVSGTGIAGSAAHNSALFLCGRVVTAFLGILTVPIVFVAGRLAYGNRAGILASLVAAVMPLWVVHSQFVTVDVPATFFVSLALLAAVLLVENYSLSTLVLAAVSTGLAAATKYNLGLVGLGPIFAILSNRSTASGLQRGALFLAITVLAFVVGCPGAVLHSHEFWFGVPGNPQSGLRYELFVHSRQGHGLLFVNTGPGWWYHLTVSLPWGMGLPLELFTLAAVGFALLRRNAFDKMLLVYLLVTFVITSLSAVRFARYMIPLFPAMALLCGAYFSTAWQKRSAIAGTVTAVVLLLTTIYTLSLLRLMRNKPAQELAAAYINNHLPTSESIAFPETPWFYSPAMVPAFGAVDPQVRRSLAEQESTRFVLRVPVRPWSTSVLTPEPGMVAVSNFETMHPLRLNQPRPKRFMAALSTYIMKRFGPGKVWGEPPHGAIIPDDILYIMPTITLYVPRS